MNILLYLLACAFFIVKNMAAFYSPTTTMQQETVDMHMHMHQLLQKSSVLSSNAGCGVLRLLRSCHCGTHSCCVRGLSSNAGCGVLRLLRIKSKSIS